MLLFFCLFIQNSYAECVSQKSFEANGDFLIKSCDISLNNDIEFAVNFWKRIGVDNISFSKEDSFNCKEESLWEKGTISIRINEKEAGRLDTDDYKFTAITDSERYILTGDLHSSVINLKPSYRNTKSGLLVAHEIGHTLGFSHVDEECYGYVMNVKYSRMGLKF